MSLFRLKARNHPNQVRRRGALDKVDDRETDPALFAEISARFGPFTVDVCASEWNRKCERYFDVVVDGLNQPWAGERVWCNPPYSNIEPWVVKAINETGAYVVMLLPNNRCEQGWWQRNVEPVRDNGGRLSTNFLPGRPRFIAATDDEVQRNQRPPFGVCLLVFEVVT